MLKTNLLATKLHPPALHTALVQRPQLLQRLDEGLASGRPLTLVSAPAGFGKSACISAWVNQVSCPFSWLSLDKADDNPWRFFTYFIAALQKINERLGQEMESVLQSDSLPSAEMISSLIINDILDLPHPFVLILDDFHVIQDNTCLQVIEDILIQQPQQLHLVLITREDPLLPLARLRAGNRMTEIRISDLRFSEDETRHFLNEIMGLTLRTEDLSMLSNRTEGWVVGLQLAGLSIRDRSDSSEFIKSLNGNHRYILSYLTEEVLNQQSQDIQEFLLQTSILEKLNAELCDAVTGRSDSADMLEHLYAANLFLISLDEEHYWYRYHQLFADLLHTRQMRTRKEQTQELHRRAGQWFTEAGLISEAIEHSISGGDYAGAVALIEKHATRMVIQGFGRTLESWMQAIPPDKQSHNPHANLAYCWMFLLRGKYQEIMPYARQVESVLSEGEDVSETSAIRAEWYALQSNLLNVQGKPQESIRMANLALQSIQPDNDYIKGLAYLGMGGAYRLMGDYVHLNEAYRETIRHARAYGNYLSEMLAASALTLMAIQYGQLHLASEVALQTIDHHERSSGFISPINGTVQGSLGIVYYQWNQLKKAFECFSSASHLSHLVGHNAGITFNAVLMARFFLAQGNLNAAEERMREAAGLVQLGIPVWLKPEVVTQQVIVYLARNNPAAAEAILNEYNISADLPAGLTYPQDLYYAAYLRLLIYKVGEQNQFYLLPVALKLADELLKEAAEQQRMGMLLQLRILRALLYAAAGKAPGGREDLLAALEIAQPEGYIRIFVDEGPVMADLLKNLPATALQRDYIASLLAAFPNQIETKSNAVSDALIEPLTERENEVLCLIAEGLKYEEIAERLVITVNTVRFYVKAIYNKLNVNNRTRAIETARQLNLL